MNDGIPQCFGSKAELGGALAVAWQTNWRRVSFFAEGHQFRLLCKSKTIEMQFSGIGPSQCRMIERLDEPLQLLTQSHEPMQGGIVQDKVLKFLV